MSHFGVIFHSASGRDECTSNYGTTGWQKLCEGMKGLRRKVWTWTKILSPNIRYIVAPFGILLAIKVPLGSKTVFLWQKVPYYMVHNYILHIILN